VSPGDIRHYRSGGRVYEVFAARLQRGWIVTLGELHMLIAKWSYSKRWSDRVWAIEGCSGIGKHVANRLLADGEQVVDVPPKLSARPQDYMDHQWRLPRGTLACYVASTGESVAVWTIEDDAILIASADPDMGLTELYTWWKQATPASFRS
jgi:hypothetical protein